MTKAKKHFKHTNEIVLLGVFAVMFIAFSIMSDHFLSVGNVMSLFAQMVELGLLTIGMTATMLSGGMDLSISAICSLSTVLLATFIGQMGMPTGLGILITFVIAMACGAFNGFLIGYLKITPMLATLGTQSLFSGIALVISTGVTVKMPTTVFGLWGRTKIGGVFPFQIILWIVAILIGILIFNYLIMGRRIYLIGANMEVARFAGINLRKNLFVTYLFSALMAFVAALVFTSKVSSGRADVADSLLLRSVSAAVFGGVSNLGGIGTITGAMTGVMVITIIINGLNMINASSYLQQVMIGTMLILVLAFRYARKK